MRRNSSNKSTATRSLSFNQILVEPVDSIETRVVHERDLKADHFQWLGLDGSPRSVGISPAYSKSGGLPALACALGARVIIIEFYSAKQNLDGSPTGSGTQIPNVERRNLLEERLLCNPLCPLYAFDLAPIALSLHKFHIHLTDAIDIQSALRISDRSVMDSVKKVTGDASSIFPKNIARAFENMLYPSQNCKDTDLAYLVQRAWLCWYIGQYNSEDIRDMFDKAHKVDTTKFSQDVRSFRHQLDYTSLCRFDKELNVLQKLEHTMLRKDNLKPQTVTHDVKTRWDSKKKKSIVQSERFANRVTPNSTVTAQLLI